MFDHSQCQNKTQRPPQFIKKTELQSQKKTHKNIRFKAKLTLTASVLLAACVDASLLRK